MQQAVKKAQITLWLTIMVMTLCSCSLTLILFTSGIEQGNDNTLSYAIATTFWIGLFLSPLLALATGLVLKKWKNRLIAEGLLTRQKLPGMIYFSWNIRNAILYTLIVFGVALIVADLCLGFVPAYIMFPVISVTLLSFMLHCVFDGQDYKVYKLIKESIDNETKH